MPLLLSLFIDSAKERCYNFENILFVQEVFPMNHLGTLTLKTDRLTLRPFSLEDAPAMYKNWANDPKVTRFLTWQPHENAEATRNLLAGWISQYGQPNTYNWCIVPEDMQEPVGNISVVRMMDDIESAEIGYCLGPAYWNRGIMSEAFAAVIEFLFDRVGVNRICARHSVSNPASGMVMQKCGLQKEGLCRQSFRSSDGQLHDMALYALLREDFIRDSNESAAV